MHNQFNFFLDSGAYSSWSRGSEIDLDEYIEFIRSNIESIEYYVNLDCIPGKPGQITTPKDREKAAAVSWSNFLYMRAAGLNPIPVYHYGEDVKWLQKMLDHGCDYIGLGGTVGTTGKLRQLWFDRMFADHLTDSDGHPIVKVHGFGMTAVRHIFRYPWFSVDSTSWLKITQNGGVYLPATDSAGNFRFDQIPASISVSNRNPKAMQDGKHVNTMPAGAKALLVQWLTECGSSLEQCAEDYYHRAVCNVSFFKKVSEQKVDKPFIPAELTQGRFF